jgi:glycerophosphoryl diester phosphodiesterase
VTPRTLIIAHRGASAHAPDNSIEAFQAAIAVGSDMIEFDVRRTRDDELIAFHDADVAGVPAGSLTREEIGERTGHPPPLLNEVLGLARGRIQLDVELKEDGYVDRVLESLRRHFEPRDVVVTSFLDAVVAQVKRSEPDIRTGLLLGLGMPKHYVRTRVSELFPVERARRSAVDYLAPHIRLAQLGALKRAAEVGLPALVWTVNDDHTIRELLADDRVAGVITDVPERALELRGL